VLFSSSSSSDDKSQNFCFNNLILTKTYEYYLLITYLSINLCSLKRKLGLGVQISGLSLGVGEGRAFDALHLRFSIYFCVQLLSALRRLTKWKGREDWTAIGLSPTIQMQRYPIV